MRKFKIILLLLLFSLAYSYAQDQPHIKWWNPANSEYPVIDGQAWSGDLASTYHRFPARAESNIKKGVWNLSRQSAGLSIRFWSNADSIFVKYKLKGFLAFPHMPATGVSGVDLYGKSYEGEWLRCWGTYSIKEESNYTFVINEDSKLYRKYGMEYQLYLPLYNEVDSLEIGVSENYFINPLPIRKEKPIVAYGTSICQGACASRPGMAWLNILGRKLDRPAINLGFSGKGRLQPEIIDLMAEVDAEVYILDCLPNLYPGEDDTYQLTCNAVKKLKERRPDVPVILTEHIGYADELTNSKTKAKYLSLNNAQEKAYYKLKSEGLAGIFLLKKEDIGLSPESFVDRIHPNDHGMLQYANAYEELIRQVLQEAAGVLSTTIPVSQSRDVYVYDWEERHQRILELNKTNPPKICLFGNSIVHFWGGEPECRIARGQDSWNSVMKPMGVRNFGYGYDMVENVLWRIHHGELDGFNAEQVVLMIGTNNIFKDSKNDIVKGIDKLIEAVEIRQPESKITVVGLLPRRGNEKRIKNINLKIAQLAELKNVRYLDLSHLYLLEDGSINESLFADGLHPNQEGYKLMSEKLQQTLLEERP